MGSKSVKEALWAQGAREVRKCYLKLDEAKHLGSPPWLRVTKSKRKVIASGARRIDPGYIYGVPHMDRNCSLSATIVTTLASSVRLGDV